MARPRLTIGITDELGEWYEAVATQKGISKTSLIVMALNTFKDQQIALNEMRNMPQLVNELKNIAEKMNK